MPQTARSIYICIIIIIMIMLMLMTTVTVIVTTVMVMMLLYGALVNLHVFTYIHNLSFFRWYQWGFILKWSLYIFRQSWTSWCPTIVFFSERLNYNTLGLTCDPRNLMLFLHLPLGDSNWLGFGCFFYWLVFTVAT